ncbi:MAG: D-aminoacyl-tRNA deacylase [Thaumarchaeota archaeon]|nr:D-aminoacyl-tRNA deacylase [Nitrososphaerota archaeon]MDD9843346.1 D-aminoacyl-tRNA deacylase [Nitrososphaerota archaeon]RNJ74004.1 MAG: D-tyrosyl-tRNA(Tyr) deacylase [Thaumarchaeota archaeon S13]
MDLLVAGMDDPAGVNMATALGGRPAAVGGPRDCGGFALMCIPGPAIGADSLEAGPEGRYGGIAFLSRHAAASGRLALTCHSTGNFGEAQAGGRDSEVAVPHAQLIKRHIRALWERRSEFAGFDLTLEATHHGPTALRAPSAFVEVGTGEAQWRDGALCARVAETLRGALLEGGPASPEAVCFGGGHYPEKFTREAATGEFAPGTIVPRRALGAVDAAMMGHILDRNRGARAALVDASGMGPHKARILGLLEEAGMEVVRL